jgi:hypothetical protein
MGIEGTYGFVYCGAEDIGIGAFSVTGSSVTGRDFGGGTYTGTATENADGTIDLKLSFNVPAGMVLGSRNSTAGIAIFKNDRRQVPTSFW